MNNKALTLSLIFAAMAFYFINTYVSGVEEAYQKKFGTEVIVIKAKRDIREQETIVEDVFEEAVIPKRYLEPSAISFSDKVSKDEKSKSLSTLIGTVAIVAIKKGEQISYNKITEPSIRTGLSPQIAPGRRAVTVPVNDVSGVAKLVKPGDRIDLIVIIDTGQGKENRVAKTLLQDVVILAVGRNVTNNLARVVEGDANKKKTARSLTEDFTFNTVTIEVEPQQAQMIALVTAAGDTPMAISLRNNDDTERQNIPPMMLNDVLGADASRIQPRAPAGNQGGARR